MWVTDRNMYQSSPLILCFTLEPGTGQKYQARPNPARKRFGPARYTAEKYRPGPVTEKPGPAQHAPIPFLGLLLTQTKTQFCDLHVEYN